MKFDELYARTLGRLTRAAAVVADTLDRRVWGGLQVQLDLFVM